MLLLFAVGGSSLKINGLFSLSWDGSFLWVPRYISERLFDMPKLAETLKRRVTPETVASDSSGLMVFTVAVLCIFGYLIFFHLHFQVYFPFTSSGVKVSFCLTLTYLCLCLPL